MTARDERKRDRSDLARRDLAYYPGAPLHMQVRFQDLDPLRHLNNVAIVALFETARLRFNEPVASALIAGGAGGRWVIARMDVDFIAEGQFQDVDIAHSVERVGTTSWTVLSGAFQGDTCIALCEATLVNTDGKAPVALNDAARAWLAQAMRPKS